MLIINIKELRRIFMKIVDYLKAKNGEGER